MNEPFYKTINQKMASTRAERAQIKNWIIGLHPVSSEVANGLIDQELSLSELRGIDPSDIGIICSIR